MNEQLVRAMAREGLSLDAVVRVLEAAGMNGKPIDIAQFAPETFYGYVIQCERLADTLAELHPLHAQHYAETEGYRAGLAMDPNYGAMQEKERTGGLLQVNVRQDGRLVGHVRMYVGRSLHTSTLHAEEDTLFLLPEHRGSFLAIRAMRYAERCLLALGVRSIHSNSKLSNNAGVLMRRLGYKPFATQFSKIFPEEKVDV